MFHPAPDRVSLHIPELVKDPTYGYLTVQWSRNAELHSVLNRVELIIEIHQESRTNETRLEHIVTGEDHRSRTVQLLVPINPASFIGHTELLVQLIEESGKIICTEVRPLEIEAEIEPVAWVEITNVDPVIGIAATNVVVKAKQKLKGRISLDVVTVEETQNLWKSKVSLKKPGDLEIEEQAYLSPSLHSKPFLLIATLEARRLQSQALAMIEAWDSTITDWELVTPGGSPSLDEGYTRGRRYKIQPVLYFKADISNPVLSIFVEEPDGKESRLTKMRIKRFVKTGDVITGNAIKWKPKTEGEYKFYLEIDEKGAVLSDYLQPKLITISPSAE